MQTLPKMSIYRHEWPSDPARRNASAGVSQVSDELELDEASEEPVQTPPPQAALRWLPVLVSACVSLVVSGAVIWVGMQHYSQEQQQMLAVAEHDEYRDAMHREVGQAGTADLSPAVNANSTAIDLLTRPTAKSAVGRGTTSRPQARARVFVDESRGKCAIYTSGLAEMPPGQIYEMWVTNADGKRVPVGTFEASRDGNGSYVTDLPIAANHVTEVDVSLEPMQGSSQPTSDLLIRASLQ